MGCNFLKINRFYDNKMTATQIYLLLQSALYQQLFFFLDMVKSKDHSVSVYVTNWPILSPPWARSGPGSKMSALCSPTTRVIRRMSMSWQTCFCSVAPLYDIDLVKTQNFSCFSYLLVNLLHEYKTYRQFNFK